MGASRPEIEIADVRLVQSQRALHFVVQTLLDQLVLDSHPRVRVSTI